MAAPVAQDYSFGNRKAESVYEELCVGRWGMQQKAINLAAISIPSAFPPVGYRPEQTLPPPNQSINSQMITNLASNIMLTMLPPGKPILKYNIIEHKLQPEIDKDPALYAMTLLALSRRALANRERLEVTNIRTAVTQAITQLLLAGNVLWKHIKIDWPSVHNLDTYVVKRNSTGQQLHTILKQKVNLGDMKLSTRTFIENVRINAAPVQVTDDQQRATEFTDEVDIYCCCKLHHMSNDKEVWLYWEEYNGEMIPDTDVMCDYNEPPLYAAWLVPKYGFNWGLSYCELYEGDMYLVENLQGALTDMAEAAALTLLFVKPGGTTSKKVLEKARNLRMMYGDANDVTVFRLDKGQDGQFVQSNLEAATRRLGAAFLRLSSIQRQAERVTAEEWKMMAAELDKAMGGLYSELAQGLGRHIIMRFLALQHEEDKSLAPLPNGIVRVGVITGLDAMGLSDEETNLENALMVLNKVFGPQGVVGMLNGTDIVRRVLAGNSVKPDGLIKDENQQAADQQKAQQATMQQSVVDGAAAPVAKEAAGAVSAAITPQMVKAMAANANNG